MYVKCLLYICLSVPGWSVPTQADPPGCRRLPQSHTPITKAWLLFTITKSHPMKGSRTTTHFAMPGISSRCGPGGGLAAPGCPACFHSFYTYSCPGPRTLSLSLSAQASQKNLMSSLRNILQGAPQKRAEPTRGRGRHRPWGNDPPDDDVMGSSRWFAVLGNHLGMMRKRSLSVSSRLPPPHSYLIAG